MNNEKEWLEGFRSGHIYKLVDALEVLTPEIAEKYKDEIVANIEEEPSLLMYLPMGIRESWPDVCMLAAEKDPYYICYVPEEYVKNHPEIIDRVSVNDWHDLVRGGKYTNMPVEVFEKNYKGICYYFKLSDDGSSRLPKEVCDKYPEFVVRAFERTLYTGGNIKALRESLPREILEKHKEDFISYKEYLKVPAIKQTMTGRVKEYAMASVKRCLVIVYSLKNSLKK